MASTPDRRPPDSGIEVKPLYRRADAPAAELEIPASSRLREGRIRTCTAAAVDDPAVRGIRVRRGVERALPVSAREGPDGLSVAFDLPTQLGYDSDDPVAQARSAAPAWRSTPSQTWSCCSTGSARRGLDVDDDQRARRRCCWCSTSSSPKSQGVPGALCAARFRTTSSRSTWPAATTSSRRGRR